MSLLLFYYPYQATLCRPSWMHFINFIIHFPPAASRETFMAAL